MGETIFIDRDGSLFLYVLAFMRSDPLYLSSLSSSKKYLQKEAEFYQLTNLITLLTPSPPLPLSIFSPTLKSPHTIIEGNEVKVSQRGHAAVFSSEEYTKGITLFHFSILSDVQWIFFGVGKEPLTRLLLMAKKLLMDRQEGIKLIQQMIKMQKMDTPTTSLLETWLL